MVGFEVDIRSGTRTVLWVFLSITASPVSEPGNSSCRGGCLYRRFGGRLNGRVKGMRVR